MRTSRKDQPQTVEASGTGPPVAEVACDEAVFFESFYRANVQADVEDWMTIGSISNPESRFHYNATENSIIRALTRLEPLPPISMARAWRMTRARARLRHLDIGSGTGHWLDFMRSVYLVSESVGVEITGKMSAFLDRKYAGRPEVRIIRSDVVGDEFATGPLAGSFDIVTAIGVMFHIVDDERWAKALRNLAAALKPAGVLLVGGEFGARTRNIQFHRNDRFDSWKEFSHEADHGKIRVNKRVRSLAHWQQAAGPAGLQIVDLVRSDQDPNLTTPENDLLVLKRIPA
jgi:SAM-dependent methyltransferase